MQPFIAIAPSIRAILVLTGNVLQVKQRDVIVKEIVLENPENYMVTFSSKNTLSADKVLTLFSEEEKNTFLSAYNNQ